MTEHALDPVVSISVSYALAVLWLTAAVHKAAGFGGFLGTLRAYRIVPRALLWPCALIIIGVEAGLGIALLAPIERALPLAAAAGLLTLYAAAIGVNLARGRRYIDCGCTGPGLRHPLGAWMVWRNLALAAAALAAGGLPVADRPLLWVDALSISATVGVLMAMYATLNRLIANGRELASVE
ncbi:MAG TPA: MauE/DoxX family redox-associated membrane protein [Gammaproteobacteria bacterium]